MEDYTGNLEERRILIYEELLRLQGAYREIIELIKLQKPDDAEEESD